MQHRAVSSRQHGLPVSTLEPRETGVKESMAEEFRLAAHNHMQPQGIPREEIKLINATYERTGWAKTFTRLSLL